MHMDLQVSFRDNLAHQNEDGLGLTKLATFSTRPVDVLNALMCWSEEAPHNPRPSRLGTYPRDK